jgi:hypothetical protein
MLSLYLSLLVLCWPYASDLCWPLLSGICWPCFSGPCWRCASGPLLALFWAFWSCFGLPVTSALDDSLFATSVLDDSLFLWHESAVALIPRLPCLLSPIREGGDRDTGFMPGFSHDFIL